MYVSNSGTFKIAGGIISGAADYPYGGNTYTKNIADTNEGAALYTFISSSVTYGPGGTGASFTNTRVENAIHVDGGAAVPPGPTGWI